MTVITFCLASVGKLTRCQPAGPPHQLHIAPRLRASAVGSRQCGSGRPSRQIERG